MHARRFVVMLSLLWTLGIILAPSAAQAQSAIAGVVRDTTGAVLPGVTVEASSPALIEKVRTVVSDDQGQYRIIDVRPGTYVVTFTLTGFSTIRREGIVLEANFTANVSVEMRVGALEETLTVSGEAPVVDVQSTQHRQVLSRELLESLPAQRSFSTNTMPAVVRATDVGGSNSNAHATMNVYGSNDGQDILVDGLSVMTAGKNPGMYYNFDANEEVVYQVGGGNAEATVGGVSINMIPRQGGNEFKGDAVALFANSSFQTSNYSDELKAAGLQSPPGLVTLWDLNGSLGGPIKRDKVWFFFSYRDWGNNKYLANAFNADGSLGVDDNHLYGSTTRVTYQMSQRHKLSAYMDRLGKTQSRRGWGAGYAPEAAYYSVAPGPINTIVKWTAVLSNRVLFEVGYSGGFFDREGEYEPQVAGPSATNPYGDIAKRDLITGRTWNATPGGPLFSKYRSAHINSSLSYVTGSHSFKVGETWANGYTANGVQGYNHGDIVQQYRNGVPDSVIAYNTPSLPRTDIALDLALFAQDSWKIGRLTFNPGLRYDHFVTALPEQSMAAGRFVPARHFDAAPELFKWIDLSPRVGVAYDLFGDGTTAIKASIGKYAHFDQTVLAQEYNPVVSSTDSRTWNDLNRDDIAQDNEIGPSTNALFGVRRTRNPDPDLKRPYSWLTNIGVQRQLWPNVGLAVTYNRRDYRRLLWTDNLAVPLSAYTLVTIPDPRGNGQTLPVYNLNVAYRGLINELDTNSDQNKRVYNGVDASINARLKGNTFTVATSVGRVQTVTCQVADPNALRFCDQTEHDIPFLTSTRVLWVSPLPYGFRVSGVFQSAPGGTASVPGYTTTYSVSRTIVPSLIQTTVSVPLTEPGSLNYPQINQFDVSLSKTLRAGRVQLEPKVEAFNVFNVNPVLSQVNVFGSSLGRPNDILPGRVARIMVQEKF